jgi:NAD(P)-dependent dehydrogenase (short-subunit alcohol dehydrogenase family)
VDLKLNNKTALVTGSTTGIGFAIASLLAQEGATVVINGRTEQKVSQAIELIKKINPQAKLIPAAADVSTAEGAKILFEKVPEIDILVNNAGIYEIKSFFDISDEDWLHIMDVNVMSGMRLSRYYLPLMLKKNWGRIIFISSESGVQIPVEMIHYGVSKSTQIALARGLAEMTINTNVTVNSVLPGPTRSEGVDQFIESVAKVRSINATQVEKEFFETVRPTSLLKRFATSEEVAALVAFVASPLSSATNGVALRVDGGVIKSAF